MALPSLPDIIGFLSSSDPDVLEQLGEAALIEAFRSAAADVPAYQSELANRGVDVAKVTDLASFLGTAPFIDKSLFGRYQVNELCRRGSLKEVKFCIPSSGSSGVFGFNVETYENVQGGTTMADLAFEYCLRVSERPAFLINAYPMGLQVPTTLPCANTGVNADVALALIKAFARHYEQLIIVSQPAFAKKLIEDGVDAGLDWAGLNTTVVTGGEGFVESWRTYISRLIGLADADRPLDRFVASSMGVGELAVNLFHEIPETIAVVRRAYRDRALRSALLGDVDECPSLFVYYPMRTFIEAIPLGGLPGGELAVSMTGLDNHMPFLRYRTGDVVRIIPYRRAAEALSRHAPDLAMPTLKLPMVAVFGRRDALAVSGRRISGEQVKEALFSDLVVAGAVTGFFKASDVGGQLTVDVQLRPNVSLHSEYEDRFVSALAEVLPSSELGLVRFYDFRAFPYDVAYERKFAYISH
jgi:phenylacetate-CoA ligase